MIEKREALLLRLPPKLAAEVRELAIANRRSINSELQVAVEAYVNAAPSASVAPAS